MYFILCDLILIIAKDIMQTGKTITDVVNDIIKSKLNLFHGMHTEDRQNGAEKEIVIYKKGTHRKNGPVDKNKCILITINEDQQYAMVEFGDIVDEFDCAPALLAANHGYVRHSKHEECGIQQDGFLDIIVKKINDYMFEIAAKY